MKDVLMSVLPYWVFLIIAQKMGWNVDREKTIEIRKSFPQDKNWNKRVKIYCGKNKKSFREIPKEYQPLMKKFLGKVIGEFVCNRIDEYTAEFVNDGDCYEDVRRHWIDDDGEEDFEIITSNGRDNPEDCELFKNSCLSYAELKKYIGENFHDIPFYGWHISDLKIYDKPKELSEFNKPFVFDDRPMKDWCHNHCEICDEENCKYDLRIKRPPQSWCYVEN